MNALVLCVGKLKEDWQREACREYLKRLGRYGRFGMTEVDDCPEPAKPAPALKKQVLDREAEALLRQIKPADRVVALAIDGDAPDSVGLSRKLSAWAGDGRRVVFVIGGSLGLSDSILRRADERLSFSRLTFPHTLMRVILA
ncbi:MAG: 23S rRNA (pseudouridine(1915)-N(3))-methyltransferase RlmH [Christensenellaceae bacterium]|nr:23S rRNA (pseudouridine(1915)-N(3))-methyltransferase RlmH [Christensenellaceae bacterium]MEA5064588.1 23S rRNA (pseudouridine(1915)-N(3))-methyltransferase RlmH [Eubacteriales bacterium]MEA5067773.1 23S rRNA (pseudouridine(1915)-N(3))-methyltransferase RlmH [Christensenellaceae bacterium]